MKMLNVWLGVENPYSQTQEAPQTLPTKEQVEAQDTTTLIGNPCLPKQTRKSESPTWPIPKAVLVGGRVDSAQARQARAKKAVEAANKMLTIAQLRTKETMMAMEQANIAVEVAKEKVGLARGQGTHHDMPRNGRARHDMTRHDSTRHDTPGHDTS